MIITEYDKLAVKQLCPRCCGDIEERHTIQNMLERARCQARHPRDVCSCYVLKNE